MRKSELNIALGKLVGDAVLVWLAFVLTYYLRETGVFGFLDIVDYSLYKSWDEFVTWSLKASVSFVVVLVAGGLYTFDRSSFWNELKKLFKSCLSWFGLVVVFYFLQRSFPFSRFVIVFNVFVSFVLLSIYRGFIWKVKQYLQKKGIGVKRLVLVTTDKSILQEVLPDLENSFEYKLIGYFSDKKLKNIELKKLGDLNSVMSDLGEFEFDEVMQIGQCDSERLNEEVLTYCRNNQKLYSYVPEVFEIQRRNVVMHQVGDLPVFEMQNTKLRGWGRVLKRLFDVVVAGVGVVVLAPVMLLVALLIKLEDPKSNVLWLYLDDGKTVVKRVGYMRRLFYCFKFRTMKSKSHMMRYKELAEKDIRGDELVKIGDDPRVTKVGKYLRRFDLDELPQLFNVLIGNMSLVGPRPHLPEEVARYKDHHQFVFNIKPGVTGLSQISGRSDLSFENEVKLDSYYIENWSLILDIKILLKTVLVVFERHGEDKS